MHHVHVQRFQDSNERRDWQLLLQGLYFVNKCEAMFSTERLKISKCTWIKCLLETNFASSVIPTIVGWNKCALWDTQEKLTYWLITSSVIKWMRSSFSKIKGGARWRTSRQVNHLRLLLLRKRVKLKRTDEHPKFNHLLCALWHRNSSYKEFWSFYYFLELNQLDFVFLWVIEIVKNCKEFWSFHYFLELNQLLCVTEIVNCKQLKQQCEEKMW